MSWQEAYGRYFIAGETGLIAFSDTEFSMPKTLEYTNIGRGAELITANGEAFIQSDRGVFRLSPEFDVARIDDFPISKPRSTYVDIQYLEEIGRFLISDRRTGALFTSIDMDVFTKIETEQKISDILGTLNDPPTALLQGRDKLYVFTQSCPAKL